MNHTIAVIGAGNIGTRHLQAISKCTEDIRLFAVDPWETSLTKCRETLDATEGRRVRDISYLTNSTELSKEIEVAVVAVSSGLRREVTEALLCRSSVRYLILEKVLFPRVADYAAVERLLEEKGVKTWVNCARRSWPYTQTLVSAFSGSESVSLRLEGNMWGIGCNTIHYVDLLAHLTGSTDAPVFDISGLDDEIIPSKRQGYVEFTGTLRAAMGKHRLELVSSPGEFNGFRILIEDSSRRFVITEKGSRGQTIKTDLRTGKEETEDFTVPYQSGLTNGVVSDLLATGSCRLTPYRQSAAMHVPMIEAFLRKLGSGTDVCSIT